MDKDFIKEYYEQDNCCTEYPIYFVIRDVEWVASYWPEEGDRFSYVHDGEIVETADSLSSLLKKLKKISENENTGLEWDSSISLDLPSSFDADWFTDKNGGHIFSEKRTWVNKNMFLLKSEAEQHLKANQHHYSKDAHVYCLHAWRAPRQAAFFKSLKPESEDGNA